MTEKLGMDVEEYYCRSEWYSDNFEATCVLFGFRRLLSIICRFVVRRSHTGMASIEELPSDSSSDRAANKFFLFETAFDFFNSEAICSIKAVEAFKV